MTQEMMKESYNSKKKRLLNNSNIRIIFRTMKWTVFNIKIIKEKNFLSPNSGSDLMNKTNGFVTP